METKRPKSFPFVLAAGGVAISFASILIKFCQEVPAIVIATYRTGLVSLFLLPMFFIRGKTYPRKLFILTLISGFGLAVHFAFWISSLKYTSVASSLFVLSIYPFLVALTGHLLLKEKLTPFFSTGALFALVGIGLIFSFDLKSFSFTLGNLLSFVGALGLVIYYIPGRVVRKEVSILPFLTVVYSTATAFLLGSSLIMGHKFTGYSAESYLYLFLLALLSQGIGHSAFNWALKYVKAGLISITTLIEPVGASFLAYFILKEPLPLRKIIGAVLISLGIVLAWRKQKENR